MRRIVADVESDGLLQELTTIHCLVLRDVETNELLSCTDDPIGRQMGYRPISEGLEVLANGERVYFHNGLDFDIPAIQKIYPDFKLRGELMDTLVVARMRWAHVKDTDFERARQGKFPAKLAGRHSLEAWGHRLGVHKGEYKQWCEENGIEDHWSEWRPEMQTYCELDTEVGKALVEAIRKAGVSAESIQMEHELAAYLSQQERNGFPFDLEAAVSFQAELAQRRQELSDELIEEFGSWFESAGETMPKKTTQYKKERRLIVEGAPYTKLKVVEFNPNSRDHIAKVLQSRYGWKPTVFTPSGKPQVDDETLAGLKFAVGEKLCEYLLVDKRLGQLSEGDKAWLRYATDLQPEGGKLTGMAHIHGRVNPEGTITHRASHFHPNLAQVPKVGKPHGKECRSLFTVPKGWVQIGADVSGLELRVLAHYMARWDGGAYAKVILEGDIHTTNQQAAGLPTRDDAKTFIYALLYGSGPENLGSIVEPKASRAVKRKTGTKLQNRFFKNLPALGSLMAAVKNAAKTKGYVELPDGRRTYIRREYSALNSLLQSAGSIITRAWICEASRRLTEKYGPQGWNGQWAALAWVHDEIQLAVRPDIAEDVALILVESIEAVAVRYNWRVPLTGEAKIGGSWAACH